MELEEEAELGLKGSEMGDGENIKKVNSRVEIDTSPPFGSVKEAVTWFGGSGSWLPFFYKLGDHGMWEIDMKKVEEQTAELEKDLIVKELEILDVLEELGTTKRMVEDLKLQIQKEALKCTKVPDLHSDEQISTPVIKEMNKEHYINLANNHEELVANLSPCPTSSPDLILMELKQAKLNLGKTINDLGMIQTSVESLNKKVKKEKTNLQKACHRLTPKYAGVSSLEEELKQTRVKPQILDDAKADTIFQNSTSISRELPQMNSMAGQFKKMADAARFEVSRAMPGIKQTNTSMKTAEMRWFAAKKMEEAARAAEAVALAELNALSSSENSSGFFLPGPEKVVRTLRQSPLKSNSQKTEGPFKKNVVEAMIHVDEANISKLSILKKLEDATKEVKHSKQALEEALNRIEIANRTQYFAEDALRRCTPEYDSKGQAEVYNTNKISISPPFDDFRDALINDPKNSNLVNDDLKPVLRPTISMRDILSRKQILPEEYVTRRQTEGHTERQRVALSQMLHELREDITFSTKAEKEGNDQKQYFTQRKKFGFIHISLPLTKQSKKKVQTSDSDPR